MFTHKLYGGKKSQWLIAFYGYGQSASVYEALFKQIQSTYNLLVIDNPMQDYQQDIHPTDFRDALQQLLVQYDISTFNTISYSMGSRLNLYIPIFFPEKVNKMMLVAPDGIVTNFWNRAAVNTPWGQRLFYFFVQHGDAYVKTLTFFHRLGIVNKSLYAFSKWHMRDITRRRNVYNAWMNMRLLRPDLLRVQQVIDGHHITLITFFGRQDPVISPVIQRKCAMAFPAASHRWLEGDHNLLNMELFSIIAKELTA